MCIRYLQKKTTPILVGGGELYFPSMSCSSGGFRVTKHDPPDLKLWEVIGGGEVISLGGPFLGSFAGHF